MNWPEAAVTIVVTICFASVVKTLIRCVFPRF